MIKQAIAAPFSKGVNFTMWLEFRKADQVHEEMFTKKDFENVRKLGCDVVRLPIHFENFCDVENDYAIDSKILGILDNVASWAEELGIYVIFDFHNNTAADSCTSKDVEGVLTGVWTKIADRYKNRNPYIVYELMNEPHGIEITVWNGIISRVFEKVRTIDKEHYIIVGGADWNSFNGMKALPEFKDDRVIYTFHFYDPHTFTHQGASWARMDRITGIPFPYDEARMPELPPDATPEEREKIENYRNVGTIEAVTQFFDQYAEFSRERNAPVYCGEFGCFAPFAKREERVNWYTIVAKLLSERNIARTSWDYYGSFGIFDFKKLMERYKSAVNKKPGAAFKMPKFPEDLDKDIVKALGLNIL